MNIKVGYILEMKKPHPCGCNRMIVLRVGADFRLKCEKCGHDFMVARSKCEKKIKKIVNGDLNND